MRIAFPLIGGKEWTGGRNYLFNLIRALVKHYPSAVTPVLFYGQDVDSEEISSFAGLAGVELVSDSSFDRRRRFYSLAQAVAFGVDRRIRGLLIKNRIDVVFETAQFFGTRLNIPTIAWIPDFQHRHLPQLFPPFARLKREFGFRAQIYAGRFIMLSSQDARQDCEYFYTATKGRTHAVHFAVPPPAAVDFAKARKIADNYDLPEYFFYLPNQFWVHKNHLLVAEALSILRKQGRKVVVAASGNNQDPRNPRYFQRLCEKIDALGVRDEFRLLGLIPYDHLGALMRSCTALLNPSLFEGWSTTVEEARSLGVPLILSDLSVHREQAGDSGNYFDPKSASSLAQALVSITPISRSERSILEATAAGQSEIRVRAFADQFLELAMCCVKQFRQ